MLFNRLWILPSTSIKLSLSYHESSTISSKNNSIIPEEETPGEKYVSPETLPADSDYCKFDEEHYSRILASNLLKLFPDSLYSTTIFVKSLQESSNSSDREIELRISAVLVYENIIKKDNASNIPIQLCRFVNGSPLFDHDDAKSCAISQAVNDLNWSVYGYKIHDELSSTNSEDYILTTNDDLALHLFKTPSWTLKSIMKTQSPTVSPITPSRLVLLIDYRANNVVYMSYRKSALSKVLSIHQSLKEGTKIIFLPATLFISLILGIYGAMDKLKKITADCDLFLSLKEYQEREVERVNIPALAAALSQLIIHSIDEDIIAVQCMELISKAAMKHEVSNHHIAPECLQEFDLYNLLSSILANVKSTSTSADRGDDCDKTKQREDYKHLTLDHGTAMNDLEGPGNENDHEIINDGLDEQHHDQKPLLCNIIHFFENISKFHITNS